MSSVYDVMLTVYYVKSPDSDGPVSCIERPPAVLVYTYNVSVTVTVSVMTLFLEFVGLYSNISHLWPRLVGLSC